MSKKDAPPFLSKAALKKIVPTHWTLVYRDQKAFDAIRALVAKSPQLWEGRRILVLRFDVWGDVDTGEREYRMRYRPVIMQELTFSFDINGDVVLQVRLSDSKEKEEYLVIRDLLVSDEMPERLPDGLREKIVLVAVLKP